MCVRAGVRDVFAIIYDSNVLPRLIMIIIKIIFLYFIEIAQTDDFPSTGTRLVSLMSLGSSFHIVGPAMPNALLRTCSVYFSFRRKKTNPSSGQTGFQSTGV